AIRHKLARADECRIAVVECSHANGDRSEDLLFPHPRSIAGREQTPTTLTRTPLDPRADRRGSGCRWCLPAASSSEGQARGSRRPLLGGVLTSDLYWSGWRDLNPRPLRPERSALPSCATPRGMPSVIVADTRREGPGGYPVTVVRGERRAPTRGVRAPRASRSARDQGEDARLRAEGE